MVGGPGDGAARERDRPEVAVVVVSYRTPDLLERCLRSVAEHGGDVSHEVIVVDNGSGDDSVDRARRTAPAAMVVDAGENLGFARAVNLGASRRRARHVLLLNPDAELHPGALAAILGFAREHPDAGIVGGATLTPAGELDRRSSRDLPGAWSHVCFASGLSSLLPGRRLTDPESIPGWDRTTPRRVGYVSGAFALVPGDHWDALGGFDERYWMYGEDVDLAIRSAALGRPVWFTPDARVTHVVGAATVHTADKWVLVLTGKVTLARRHLRGPRRWVAVGALVAGAAVRAAGARVLGGGRGGQWPEVWRRRRTWLAGYAAPSGEGVGDGRE